MCVHITVYFLYLQGNITSFSFNLSAVSIEKLSVSQQVAFRVSAQNSFLISNFSDASYVTLNNTSGTARCGVHW